MSGWPPLSMVGSSTPNHQCHRQPRPLKPLTELLVKTLNSTDMKKTGFWFYLWALGLNAGLVILLLFEGGVSGFGAARVGWVCAALAAYLLVVIAVITSGRVFHPVLTYGLPCVVILLLGYEIIYGPSLNLVTLILLVLGKSWEIWGAQDGRKS